MATSTLIQYLEPKDTDGVALPGGVSHRRQVETYLITLTNAGGVPATLTIPAGSWMAWDTSQSGSSAALFVTEAANVALGNPLVCGVLLRAAVERTSLLQVISTSVVSRLALMLRTLHQSWCLRSSDNYLTS
jgi:hypothetical protein